MTIRKTTMTDLPTVMQIYDEGRATMRQTGNPDQWQNNHPPQELIEKDIQAGSSYVCLDDAGKIAAVFYFAIEKDPTYGKIDGAWINDEPYGVVHRIARGFNAKGAGAFCMEWAFAQYPNVRIDTHKDNGPMITLLERLGYTRCGIIWIASGDERVAFQKV
ncbi:MAG: GNAT family N-acetyltransferase [Defluviitaleaceae bacterium]|nr:GNAT family N-acetyltransferase [Defluviitaleaceae bacterium]